jgi:hypothetical protein
VDFASPFTDDFRFIDRSPNECTAKDACWYFGAAAKARGFKKMNRRELLTGAAGLAASDLLTPRAKSARRYVPFAAATKLPNPVEPSRRVPVNPITLHGDDLAVLFDREHAVPYAYEYTKRRIGG